MPRTVRWLHGQCNLASNGMLVVAAAISIGESCWASYNVDLRFIALLMFSFFCSLLLTWLVFIINSTLVSVQWNLTCFACHTRTYVDTIDV
jgi:hypothetical protein